MKKYILIIFILLSATLKGQTIEELFKSMPAEILAGVSEDFKTMLLVDTGTVSIPYFFGEIVKLNHSENYLKIQTSEIGTTQLILLPVEQDSVIISVIKTVCGGVKSTTCDSDISFYTTEWEKLDNSHFIPEITAESFFDSSKKESENYKYALSLPDISPISAEFNETDNNLTLTFNYKDYLSDAHKEIVNSYLKSDTIVLSWQDSSFK